MAEQHAKEGQGVVHKSAHPSLPPAAPQQVVQYLLAKNFYLTALELLVEAQQAGHGDDVRDLEAFFSDPERFPPEELARHQPGNAFELQAAGRERESRLQLVEYELRLAKEDLSEMARKLAAAQERQGGLAGGLASGAGSNGRTATGAPSSATSLGNDKDSSVFSAAASLTTATGSGGRLTASACDSSFGSGVVTRPSPAELHALNATVFAHLQRQGLLASAMMLEEEYGGSLRPSGHGHSSPLPGAAHGSDAEVRWELWSWYQAAAASPSLAPAEAEAAAVTLVEGGTAATAPQQGGGGTTAAVDAAVGLEELLGQLAGLVEQCELDRVLHCGDGGDGEGGGEGADAVVAVLPAGEATQQPPSAQFGSARRQLEGIRGTARAAALAATQLHTVLKAAPQHHPPPPSPLVAPRSVSQPSPAVVAFPGGDVDVLELLDISSSAITAPANNLAAASDDTESTTVGATGTMTPHRTESQTGEQPPPSVSLPHSTGPLSAPGAQPADERLAATTACGAEPAAPGPAPTPGSSERSSQPHPLPTWLAQLDSGYMASLEGLRASLVGALPRLVPALTYKSRVEVLPLLVTAAQASPDWSDRQQLLGLSFNLAPAPDHQQRQAIIEACLELCRAFGPGWAASELLPLCCRQASSPSAERRTLVAEALGAVVGLVDTGTQAHVVLTQLSQLARDRIERVREAAVLSLARLVPRLPPARPYLSTLEALLLPAATDPAEAVHSAALSYLVPALLTWQSPVGSAVAGGVSGGTGGDGVSSLDMLLVNSSLARVVGELGIQVRLMEQQQQQQQDKLSAEVGQASGAAVVGSGSGSGSGGGGGGGSFGGTFLRYSLVAPGGNGGSHSASATGEVDSATTTVAAGPGATTLPRPPASPAAPVPPSPFTPVPPPPVAVSFDGRQFPSAAHLAVYQLLALYVGLVPAVRQAALQTRPPWAAFPTATLTASPSPVNRYYHHRAGSFGEVTQMQNTTTLYEAPGGSDAPRLRSSSPSATSAWPLSPTHRRTVSHPVLSGSAGERPVSTAARGSYNGTGSGGEEQGEQEGSGAQVDTQVADGDGGGVADSGAVQWEQDVALAAWATHPEHSSWKTLEWVMQHVVPELLRLLRCVNPATPTEAEVWRQAVAAMAATCSALGAPLTRAALIPVFLAASGYGATAAAPVPGSGGGAEYDAPTAVRDLCVLEQPRTAKTLRIARQTVLPVLFAGVLAPSGQLRPHLEALMGTAHELRQRWLMEALPNYISAITLACATRAELTSDVLRVLETLLSGAASSGGGGGANTPTPTSTLTASEATAQTTQAPSPGPGSGGPASTAVGLCCAALARALVPLASLELASRRLLPALMALMSYGEVELQRACVGVLAELGLRFWAEGPRVSEQVLAVYDSLLEQGSHVVQLEVLAAGMGLAVAAAPSAAVSAAAAAQVEWLLMVVRATAARLATMPHAAANTVPVTALYQHRAVACQLLAALRAVAPYDLQLPRLQANFASALEAMQRCKALLTDPAQQAALTALVKERPTGPSATAGPSISSSTPVVNVSSGATAIAIVTPITPTHSVASQNTVHRSAPTPAVAALLGPLASGYQVAHGSGSHGTAPGPAVSDTAQAGGNQMRSRFDAFRQRLMKRRDDSPTAAVLDAGPGAGGRSKETFFSDDEEGV